MSKQKLYKSIECAIPHKCTKEKAEKCFKCEIGYRFVANEPMALSCGHVICTECTQKIKNEKIKCKLCSADMTSANSSHLMSEHLIRSYLTYLSQELKDKYTKAIHLLEGIF